MHVWSEVKHSAAAVVKKAWLNAFALAESTHNTYDGSTQPPHSRACPSPFSALCCLALQITSIICSKEPKGWIVRL